MKDYDQGFSNGFAAAIRQGGGGRHGCDGQPTIADGFKAGENTKRIALTLSNDLFDAIREAAVTNNRSMSAEIRARLEGR